MQNALQNCTAMQGREEALRGAFLELDADGSGHLDAEELAAALAAAGFRTTKHQARPVTLPMPAPDAPRVVPLSALACDVPCCCVGCAARPRARATDTRLRRSCRDSAVLAGAS